LTFEEFLALETAWDELLHDSAACVPFLGHAWLSTWWRHFGQALPFECLVVRDGPRLRAAAALSVRSTRVAGLPCRVVEIVGTGPVPTRGMGLADKADLLARQDDPGALAALAQALVGRLAEADLLDLKGLDAASPTIAALRAAGAAPQVVPRSASPYLPLDGGWEAYLASRSQRFRKQLKRAWRQLEGAGPAAVERYDPAAPLAPWLDEIVAVNARSWTGTRGTALWQQPALRAFFADLLSALGRAGRLELHVLRVGGTAGAYEIAFDLGQRLFAYNASFRDDLAHASPGSVVMAELIRAGCARGRREYDMGRGADDYKLRWSDLTRSEVELLIPAPRLRARFATLLGPRLRARLRRIGWLVELDDRLSGARNRRG
jgi:CelD/BcsL family acetyltransferase involved in cellulose biosynthesis